MAEAYGAGFDGGTRGEGCCRGGDGEEGRGEDGGDCVMLDWGGSRGEGGGRTLHGDDSEKLVVDCCR